MFMALMFWLLISPAFWLFEMPWRDVPTQSTTVDSVHDRIATPGVRPGRTR